MSAQELKPCPACGGDATQGLTYVSCIATNCQVTGPNFDADGSRWNAMPRRAPAAAPIDCQCTTQACCSACARRELAPRMSDGELIARAMREVAIEVSRSHVNAPAPWDEAVTEEIERRAAARKAAP